MAKSSVFQTSANSSVVIGTEVTPGTATLNTHFQNSISTR